MKTFENYKTAANAIFTSYDLKAKNNPNDVLVIFDELCNELDVLGNQYDKEFPTEKQPNKMLVHTKTLMTNFAVSYLSI